LSCSRNELDRAGIRYSVPDDCICVNIVWLFGISDLIRDIRDPEKPETLEQLNIVYEDGVKVEPLNHDTCLISIEFTPTIPHCSLATLIGESGCLISNLYDLWDWAVEILGKWN